MLSKKTSLGIKNGSAIRAMFVEGKLMAEQYGAENVYDFSLGNPATPAPEKLKEVLIDKINSEDKIVYIGFDVVLTKTSLYFFKDNIPRNLPSAETLFDGKVTKYPLPELKNGEVFIKAMYKSSIVLLPLLILPITNLPLISKVTIISFK